MVNATGDQVASAPVRSVLILIGATSMHPARPRPHNDYDGA